MTTNVELRVIEMNISGSKRDSTFQFKFCLPHCLPIDRFFGINWKFTSVLIPKRNHVHIDNLIILTKLVRQRSEQNFALENSYFISLNNDTSYTLPMAFFYHVTILCFY